MAMELLAIAVTFAVLIVGGIVKSSKYTINSWNHEKQKWEMVDADFWSWLKYLKGEASYLKRYTQDLSKYAVMQTWWSLAAVILWRIHMKLPVGSWESFGDMLVQMMLLKGAVAMLQVMKKMQAMYEQMKKIVEKTTYIEMRLMEMGGNIGDKSRHLDADMEAFDADLGEKTWLERRLRSHFEAYFKANAVTSGGIIMPLWRLICTEVVLRKCRDYLMERVSFVVDGEATANWKKLKEHLRVMKEKVKQFQLKRCRHLKNFQMTQLQFWSPLPNLVEIEMVEVGELQVSNFLEFVLHSQILERKIEICKYLKQILDLETMTELKDNCTWLTDDMPGMVKEWHVAMKKHENIAAAAN